MAVWEVLDRSRARTLVLARSISWSSLFAVALQDVRLLAVSDLTIAVVIIMDVRLLSSTFCVIPFSQVCFRGVAPPIWIVSSCWTLEFRNGRDSDLTMRVAVGLERILAILLLPKQETRRWQMRDMAGP